MQISSAPLFLNAESVASLIEAMGLPVFMSKLADTLAEDYGRWEAFHKSPRVAAHHPRGVVELMPIWDEKLFAFKYVNGHPPNPQDGLMTIVAFGVLFDMATGYPLMISDMTHLTALRTSACAAMVARYCARPDSKRMAMIGNGSQSEYQILAFHYLLGITEVTAFDVDPAATQKLIANLAHVPGLAVTAATSTREAVRGVDIITTCTADKKAADIITADMLEPGVHINAIGGDCPGKTELAPDVLRRAARVIVEYEPQTRIEGDIQRLPADFPVTEIWKLVNGVEHGRTAADEITVYDCVGFALEDFSALRCLYLSAGSGGGGRLPIFPDLDNVKNLFGHGFGAKPAQKLRAVG